MRSASTRSTVWLNSLLMLRAKLMAVRVFPSPLFTLVTRIVFDPLSLVF